jgi:hypothetical protein
MSTVFKTIQELISLNTTNTRLISIFELRGHIVKRYEVIKKLDGASFGIYLYKDNPHSERSLLTDIVSEVSTIEALDFILEVYEDTPVGEEFCLHFPLDSEASLRCHTKPSFNEYIKYRDDYLGSLGIKGFTITQDGIVNEIKYYFMKDDIITTKKYTPTEVFKRAIKTYRILVSVDIKKKRGNIYMHREDGQIYDMYTLTAYNSFSLTYLGVNHLG